MILYHLLREGIATLGEFFSIIRDLYRLAPCSCGGERREAGPACGWIVCLKCGEVE